MARGRGSGKRKRKNSQPKQLRNIRVKLSTSSSLDKSTMADQNTSCDSSNVHPVEQGDVSLLNNIHNSANSPIGTPFMPLIPTPGPCPSVASTPLSGNLMNGAVFYQNTPIVNNPLSHPPWVDQLFARLAAIEQRVSNIDKIVSDVGNLSIRVSNLEKTTGNLGNSTGTIKRETAGHLELLKEQNEKLKREVDDLKCRSMRDNLMFFGLAEIANENCFALISEFCKDMLDIHDIRGYMDRAHRVGKFDRNKRRPIVVKFNNFNTGEEIRRASHNLRGTRFAIGEQFRAEERVATHHECCQTTGQTSQTGEGRTIYKRNKVHEQRGGSR